MRVHRILVVGTVAAVAVLGLAGTAQADDRDGHGHGRAAVVKVTDDCEVDSFTAAGLECVGDGDTTVDEFGAEFARDGEVDAWAFRPRHVEVDEGQRVKAVNVGGEFHTFTRVEHFGGGCVPDLNAGQEPVA